MLMKIFRCSLTLTFAAVSATAALADSRTEVSTINGAVLYGQLCAKCHGAAGRPEEKVLKLLDPPPSDLTMKSYKTGDSRDDIIRVIRFGTGRNMIHYQDRLSDEQAAALADHLLQLKAAAR